MGLPLLFVLFAVGCDNDNESNAQDMGEVPAPGAEQASTTFSGQVIAPGDESCTGGIAGIMDGDGIEVVMTPTMGKAGTATVSVNQGSDGTIDCMADGGEFENIDLPPSSFIVCKATTVSEQITGVKVGDEMSIVIEFSGESPEIKQAAIVVMASGGGCMLVRLDSFSASS